MPTSSQTLKLNELLDRYERAIADAFRAAVADLRSNADLQRLIAALEAGDISAALDALHLDPAAYGPMQDAVQTAYGEAGRASAEMMSKQTPAAVVIRFDTRNLQAEAWLREHSSQLITRIVAEQRKAVQAAMVDKMERGAAPRTAALAIVGRTNRATGQREGGILGLSSPQEAAVRAARAELASGDAAALKAYLGRTRRDKRFDRSVTKAIRGEEPLAAETARKAIARYEARLLELRGQTIGRTEAMTAISSAQNESLRQAVESGILDASQIRRIWRSAADLRVRDTHRALNGESVGLYEDFTASSGARLRFPGDPSAPASETINCRCILNIRVDYFANVT